MVRFVEPGSTASVSADDDSEVGLNHRDRLASPSMTASQASRRPPPASPSALPAVAAVDRCDFCLQSGADRDLVGRAGTGPMICDVCLRRRRGQEATTSGGPPRHKVMCAFCGRLRRPHLVADNEATVMCTPRLSFIFILFDFRLIVVTCFV